MDTIRAVVIDDESNALEVIRIQLSEYCDNVDILALCNSGEAGIKAIQKYKPDLVFLDIEMPHKNGFDVLNETKNIPYQVIFTTAYDQFAVKAFKYSAVDYLLKPIDIEELQHAVNKIRKQPQVDLDAKITALFKQMNLTSITSQKIALPVGDAMQFFAPDDIVRCESESNYTHIFLTNGKKITTAKTLKDVEEIFRGLDFCRVHQSHLINMSCITKFIKGENAYLMMSDQAQVPVSRNKKDEFMERFRKV